MCNTDYLHKFQEIYLEIKAWLDQDRHLGIGKKLKIFGFPSRDRLHFRAEINYGFVYARSAIRTLSYNCNWNLIKMNEFVIKIISVVLQRQQNILPYWRKRFIWKPDHPQTSKKYAFIYRQVKCDMNRNISREKTDVI